MELEFLSEIHETKPTHEPINFLGEKEIGRNIYTESEFHGKVLICEINKFVEKEGFIKYKLGIIIGEGGFSKCYKCLGIKKCKMNIYAEKKLDRKTSEKLLMNEIIMYKYLECENIVELKDFFYFNSNYYLIFKYCENKDLYYLLKKE